MKIAVVATYDVTNINNWSGTATHVFNILNKHFDATPVQINLKRNLASYVRGFYYNRIEKKKYYTTFDKHVHKDSAAEYREKLKDKFDLIITFDYFLIPSMEGLAKRIILFTDATFDNLLDYYDYRSNLCRPNVQTGHQMQLETMRIVSHAILSSAWAKTNAVKRYHADPKKLVDFKYGSNLSTSLSHTEVDAVVDERLQNPQIKLLFPIVYWERKGGEYVLEILSRLNAIGISAQVVVAGRMPADIDQSHIGYLGYLDKRFPEQEAELIKAFRESHFLIMPSKADCTPIVFAEANSFALPIITTNTGGIPDVVNDDLGNGVAYTLDETYSDKVVSYIRQTLSDRDAYTDLCKRAHAAYVNHFDWQLGEEILVGVVKAKH